MKKKFISFVMLFCSVISFASNLDLTNLDNRTVKSTVPKELQHFYKNNVLVDRLYVNAEDGLRVRKNPNLDSEKIYKVPYRFQVQVVALGEIVTIDDITSAWVEIVLPFCQWQNDYQEVPSSKSPTFGWVFGGYLVEDIPEIEQDKWTTGMLVEYLTQNPWECNERYVMKFTDKNYSRFVPETDIGEFGFWQVISNSKIRFACRGVIHEEVDEVYELDIVLNNLGFILNDEQYFPRIDSFSENPFDSLALYKVSNNDKTFYSLYNEIYERCDNKVDDYACKISKNIIDCVMAGVPGDYNIEQYNSYWDSVRIQRQIYPVYLSTPNHLECDINGDGVKEQLILSKTEFAYSENLSLSLFYPKNNKKVDLIFPTDFKFSEGEGCKIEAELLYNTKWENPVPIVFMIQTVVDSPVTTHKKIIAFCIKDNQLIEIAKTQTKEQDFSKCNISGYFYDDKFNINVEQWSIYKESPLIDKCISVTQSKKDKYTFVLDID